MTPTNLGKLAYEGYFEACNGKSLISGAPLPSWEDQAPQIQAAWTAAAHKVICTTIVLPAGTVTVTEKEQK